VSLGEPSTGQRGRAQRSRLGCLQLATGMSRVFSAARSRGDASLWTACIALWNRFARGLLFRTFRRVLALAYAAVLFGLVGFVFGLAGVLVSRRAAIWRDWPCSRRRGHRLAGPVSDRPHRGVLAGRVGLELAGRSACPRSFQEPRCWTLRSWPNEPSATGIELLGDPGGLVVLFDHPVVPVLRHDALDLGEEMLDAWSDHEPGAVPP
jgi:hypothetical protein